MACNFCMAQWSIAQSTLVVDFDIPAQPLDAALLLFSIQTDINIIGLSTDLTEYSSQGVVGRLSVSDALNVLLANSGLTYRLLENKSIAIYQKNRDAQESSVVDDEPYLEEVVVSATRRSSNLQDTPIAVTALKQQLLNRNQVRDLRDITNIVPGLEMINTAPQAAILVQLRGVGTTNITEIADGPVAIHVDGVYAPRSQSGAALLYDIDRVEVLRGPQGTLFGRNSSSGSINVYNRQPTFDGVFADLSLSWGNYQQRALRAAVNLPASDTLSVRLAAAVNKHDAYTELLDNYAGFGPQYPVSEDELDDYDRALDLNQIGPETADQSSWRLSTLWQPNDSFRALISFERYRDQGRGVAQLDPTLVEQGIRGVVLDSPSFLDLRNDALRARLDYSFSFGTTLSYIFGASRMTREQIVDADNGRDGSFEQQHTDNSRFLFSSHELQLQNSDDERLRWVLGAFASQEKNQIVFAVDQQNAGGGRSPAGASSWISDDEGAAVSYAVQPDRRVESLGIFAQATYDLNPFSRLTMGTRYTKDTKSDRGGRALNCRITSVLGPYIEVDSIGPGAPRPEQIYADSATRAAIAAGLPHDNGTNQGISDEPCWVRQVNDFSATWENTSGLIRYDFDVDEDVMVYSSISSGFKSGHIQDAGNNAAPETVVNYELGVKSQFFNDSLRVNAALFSANYDDLQFSNQDRLDINGDGVADTGGSTVVRNASKATINGLELEVEWAISAYDNIQFIGTLLDARFDEFEIPDTLYGNLFNPFVSEQFNSTLDPVNLSGNSPPRTPSWKFSMAYEHIVKLQTGRLTPRILATFSDEYFLDIYNRDSLDPDIFPSLPQGGKNLGIQEAYQLYDVSLSYEHFSKKWSVDAFIKNITDENIKIDSGNFITENGFIATYMPPRTYGITFKYILGNG